MAYQIFIDGFDRSGLSKWSSHDGFIINSVDSRREGSLYAERLYGPSSNTDILKSRLFTSSTYATIGFALNLTGIEQAIRIVLGHNWNPQVYLQIEDNGFYYLYNGSGDLIWSCSSEILINNWNHLEYGVFCNESGRYEIRLNGSTVVEDFANTRNIANSTINSAHIEFFGSGNTGIQIDDLHIVYGDELKLFGDCRVDVLNLTENSIPQQWVPVVANTESFPTANNYQILNKDIDGFLITSEFNTTAIFEANNINHRPYQIFGVQVVGNLSKSDAGTALVTLELETGGSRYSGQQITLSSTDTTYWYSTEKNPKSNTAWNSQSVKAMKVGVKSLGV